MKNKKNIISVIIVCVAILCLGVVGSTASWFFNSDNNNITITLKNGIQLSASGLMKDDSAVSDLTNNQSYSLILENNTGVVAGANNITVNNVKLKVKSGVDSSDVYLRYKIGYSYNSGNGVWVEGSASNCYLTSGINANAATTSAAGFKEVGGWFYYFKHSTSDKYENLQVLSTTDVALFADNIVLSVVDTVPPEYSIKITITIDAVQATQNAAQAEWVSALS